MSHNIVNQTTGALTKVAGLFDSETLSEISEAFPSTASSSNKLATMADVQSGITDSQWTIIESII